MGVQAEFIKTAARLDQLPHHSLPEVALVGRSNAGKSSLLNSLVQRKKMAFVSRQPGKTRNLNFFEVDKKYVFVDLPGYGFAKTSRKERASWGELIEGYISQREQLVGLILVMDCRRSWAEEEQMIVNWLETIGKKGLVALTKTDKLNQKQKLKKTQEFKSCPLDCYWISNTKKQGISELERAYFKYFLSS